MFRFLLQRFNRSVEAGLKTLFITLSEGQEECCASGAYHSRLYKAEIPKFFPSK